MNRTRIQRAIRLVPLKQLVRRASRLGNRARIRAAEELLGPKYRIERTDEGHSLHSLLYRCLRDTETLRFVQIGANDGVANDSIHPFVVKNKGRVAGVVVEPMRDVFELLKATYREFPAIVPVNVAIHNTRDEMELHRVDPALATQMPEWTKGIASFNPDHHVLSGTPHEAMTTEKVACIPLRTLLERFEMTNLDFLQTDTEGYDLEIVGAIDLDVIRPRIVRFEHGVENGVMSNDGLRFLLNRFYDHGYFVIIEGHNAIAYDKSLAWDS